MARHSAILTVAESDETCISCPWTQTGGGRAGPQTPTLRASSELEKAPWGFRGLFQAHPRPQPGRSRVKTGLELPGGSWRPGVPGCSPGTVGFASATACSSQHTVTSTGRCLLSGQETGSRRLVAGTGTGCLGTRQLLLWAVPSTRRALHSAHHGGSVVGTRAAALVRSQSTRSAYQRVLPSIAGHQGQLASSTSPPTAFQVH